MIKQNIDQIASVLNSMDNWDQRYQAMMDMGQKLPVFPEKYRTESNIVRGCNTVAWVFAELNEDNTLRIFVDGDSDLARGILAMVRYIYSSCSLQEIIDDDLGWIVLFGLDAKLSQVRLNGLKSLIKLIKSFALAYQLKVSKK